MEPQISGAAAVAASTAAASTTTTPAHNSSRSSSSVTDASKQAAWVEAVVGRDWEIFWNEDEENDEVSNQEAKETSSTANDDKEKNAASTSQSAAATATENNNDKDTGKLPEKQRDVNERASSKVPAATPDTVMQDADPASQGGVEPSRDSSPPPSDDATTTNAMETEETESKASGNVHNDAHAESEADEEMSDAEGEDDDEESKVVHEDGWYLGYIEAFVGEDDAGIAIFRIRFVGDEETCEMPLRQEHVRPCGQRWIIRSLALLQLADPQTVETLPPDTQLPRDAEALSSIRQRFDSVSLPALARACQQAEDSPAEMASLFLFSLERMQGIQKLSCLVEEQIHLRSMLGPVDEDDSETYAYDTGCDTTPSPPSEAYINHLLQSLKDVKDACAWVGRAYRLLTRVYGVDGADNEEENDDRITRETLLDLGLGQGQKQIEILSQLDLLNCSNRKKRKRITKSPSSSEKPASRRLQNRNKRQRIEALYQNSQTSTPVAHGASQQPSALELQPQDLWVSTDVVTQYLRRVLPEDLPWYFSAVADMLRVVDAQLIEKFRSWEQNAEIYLGRRRIEPESSSAEAVVPADAHPNVSDTDENDEEPSYVSYQNILSAVEAAENDSVLSRFDFVSLVADLRRKLLDIDDFEVRTLREICHVLEDVGHVKADTDPLLATLRSQLEIANDPKSKVGNIHPLGRPSTDLTRDMIENAIVYRNWYLDLLYAESTRERVDFVESVVNRSTRLPPLQSSVVRSPSECTFDLSLTLDAIAPRVHTLSRRPLDKFVIFNRYKSALIDRQGAACNHKWLEAKLDLEKALAELSQASVLSIPEEMIFCRKDIINWLRNTEEMWTSDRPPFEMVQDVYNDLDTICRGQSLTRTKVVKDLRQNSQVDSEIRKFVLADLEPFKDRYVTEVRRLFSLGHSWKTRYDGIAAGLLAHGNSEVRAVESGTKNASMIDLKRIEDLIAEYKRLPVSLDTEYKILKGVHGSATQWTETVQQKLGSDISLDDALVVVDNVNAEDVRPRGVILHPTRQNLNCLSDLLRWHQQVRAFLGEGSLNPRPYHLIAEGVEIIEAFSATRKGDGWYQPKSLDVFEMLSSKFSSQKPKRLLSIQKLQSNPLVASLLSRLLGQDEEERLNFPLGHLLFFVWELQVESLLQRVVSSVKGSFTVDELVSVDQAIPCFDKAMLENIDRRASDSPRQSLHRLAASYQGKIESARNAFSKSKSLQRDCIRNPEDARSHFSLLKEIQTFFKGNQLAVDRDLEAQLDREVKLFSWMVSQQPRVFHCIVIFHS